MLKKSTMDSSGYKKVIDAELKNNQKWVPFLRQVLVCSGVWASYFVCGLCVGAPTVFIPQIRRENNSTAVISDEMASWLTSVTSFSGLPCVLLLSVMSRLIGRKISFIITIIDSFIAFIIFYFSNSVVQILLSEIMQGLLSAAQIVVSVTVLAEYASPKYRGFFLTIKSATFFWGIWVSNAIGTFFHWKNIGLLGITIALYSLTTAFIWPASPYWLASRGRYEECAASHRWLKGCDDESEKELKVLIQTQQEYARSCDEKKSFRKTVKDLFMTLKHQEFYKPVLISTLTGLLSILCGKLVFTVYAIDIVKGITKSESTAYTAMLILDGITIVSMYIGCALARILKRRTLLFTSAICGVFVLYSLSLYLYLIKLAVIVENKYVTISLLMLFSIAVSCGPLIISTSVCAELIPMRSRNLAICVIAITGKFVIGMMLKMAPYLFKAFNSHGTFLCFAISSSIAIALLFKYLPETKDKTLQEIADIMNGIEQPIQGEDGKLLRKESSSPYQR